jgi:hypothetical protein
MLKSHSIAVPHQNSHRLSEGFVETNEKLLIHYILPNRRSRIIEERENI